VKKLCERKFEDGDYVYLVEWVTHGGDDDENTWEPRSGLLLSVPKLVQEYDDRCPYVRTVEHRVVDEGGGVQD